MAIAKIAIEETLVLGQVLLAGKLPVVTTDEVAVEIQKGTDEFDKEIAIGFTSLTDHNCSKSCSSQVIS